MKPAWQRAAAEAPIRPDMPIIDSHHHFWGDGPAALRFGRALPADFAAMIAASGHTITATVFIECMLGYRKDGPEALRCVGETESVEAALFEAHAQGPGRTRLAGAIMGFAELLSGDRVSEVLARRFARYGVARPAAAVVTNASARSARRPAIVRRGRQRSPHCSVHPST